MYQCDDGHSWDKDQPTKFTEWINESEVTNASGWRKEEKRRKEERKEEKKRRRRGEGGVKEQSRIVRSRKKSA